MFEGRNLLIASKHKKERVIGPLVMEALGIKDLSYFFLSVTILLSFNPSI